MNNATPQTAETIHAELPVRVYKPESLVRHPADLVRDTFSDLWNSRDLTQRLFLRNLRSQYRQTILGYFWCFLPPIASAAVWIFLQSQGVVQFDGPAGLPYALFALIGTTFWQTFADALVAPINALNSGKAMFTKVNFPREALIFAQIGDILFNYLLRLTIFIPVFIYYRDVIDFHWTIPLALLASLSLIILGLAFGLLLAPIGLLYQDVGRGLKFAVQFAFFATPVVYVPFTSYPASLLNYINPAAPLITASRELLVFGSSEWFGMFTIYTIASIILAFFGLLMVRIAMPVVVERMNA